MIQRSPELWQQEQRRGHHLEGEDLGLHVFDTGDRFAEKNRFLLGARLRVRVPNEHARHATVVPGVMRPEVLSPREVALLRIVSDDHRAVG